MRNLRPHPALIKPHEPRADIDRHAYADRCQLAALTFLRSWKRACERQVRANDAEELEGAQLQPQRSSGAAVA